MIKRRKRIIILNSYNFCSPSPSMSPQPAGPMFFSSILWASVGYCWWKLSHLWYLFSWFNNYL